MKEVTQILDFMVEIEKLKGVLRKSRPVGLKRHENSGEHSWHVCVSALMLKDYADEAINIDRVIRMLLIHDLGEIDAGDKIVYESETTEQKNKEWNGVKRVLDMLPNRQGEEYLALWEEFELGESADAKYAKAIDRIPPLLHNINDDGYGWKKHDVPKEKVLNFNQQRISAGGEKIWEGIEAKLKQAIVDGILT
ncbi:HD domain-containing protein [Vibrio sp. D404a]|uniref:HD domain-containing protein n=1 Tax=unclassified Vibrio TaxID=2614977 RepID=UPI0025534BD2|nr:MULTISPECIES: HD domain-containing protein [unclassified Vibrio]MDK9736066.1 HD domain-containing protein [Vibrio sp. D404a]MDK9797768.1 HD domain-containing protein [Vibrio sp. D449a]